MFNRVDFTLQNDCLLDRQRAVLAAVSGGPDSLCMLHLLWRLGYPLIVAHLDHGLRTESVQEAAMVQHFAESLGVRCVCTRRDVQAYATRNSLSIEEAARIVRYHFLFEQAEIFGVQAVAVGHNADDQVETVLMHLLRGAGLSGLRGMSYFSLPNPWSRTISLVRPLLGIWRDEIMDYVSRSGLQPSLDASNLERRFYRNRLRHELVPYLEELNPGARRRIWTMATLLQDEDEVIETLVENAWVQCCQIREERAVAFDAGSLRGQPVGVQRRLLRRAMAHLRQGLRDIDYQTVERALDFLMASTRSGQADLAAGLRLEMEGERLWIADWEVDLAGVNWPQLAPGRILELAVPGEVNLPSGWRLVAESLAADESSLAQALSNADPYQAWLDLGRLALPLSVRARRAGERFRPLGMAGHSLKLSDFMVNVHLPRQARLDWPLVVSGEEVVWVPGYRISETVNIGQNTREIIQLILKSPEVLD